MISRRTADLAMALQSLAPGSEWFYENDDYSTIEWFNEDIEQPTQEAVEAEIIRLQEELDAQILAEEEATAAREAAKESALAKLAKLGLTEEEAKAVIGL